MTDGAGAITGELELLTRLTPDGGAVEAMVRYAGAQDLYTVSGSPVRAVSGRSQHVEGFETVPDGAGRFEQGFRLLPVQGGYFFTLDLRGLRRELSAFLCPL